VCGLAVSSLALWSRTLPDRTASMAARWSRRWQPRRAAQATLAVLVAVLIAGQAVLSFLHISAVAQGQFDAADRYLSFSYGYPLGEVQRADALLRQLEHQQSAVATLISLPVARYRSALDYLLVREEPTRMDFPGDCLVLPAADMSPALVVITAAG